MNLNLEIIDALRKRRASGEKPSALLKYLGSEYPDDRGLGFTAMKYFREAFGLSLRQVLSIPDWVHGLISDERVDEHLLRELRVSMQTAESAQQAALAFLSNGPFAGAYPVLAISNTQEFDEGWVFFYQSASFLQTGDFNEMLLGNAPIFIPRNGAPARHISHHRSIEESMAAFRYSGNTEAIAKAQVRLFDWKRGALAISAVQAIRQHSSLGLGAAKKTIDNCLDGIPSMVDTSSVTSARDLVSELLKVGFVAEITYGD